MINTTLSHSMRGEVAQAGLDAVMLAERQVSEVIPHVIAGVWSVELSRMLRSALAMSWRHQEALRTNFNIVPNGEKKRTGPESAETAIASTLESQPKGSIRDLSLTLLVAGMIRQKIRGYEGVLNQEQFMKYEDRRLLGGALSDEVSTGLFLQELAERFVFQQFSEEPH